MHICCLFHIFKNENLYEFLLHNFVNILINDVSIIISHFQVKHSNILNIMTINLLNIIQYSEIYYNIIGVYFSSDLLKFYFI